MATPASVPPFVASMPGPEVVEITVGLLKLPPAGRNDATVFHSGSAEPVASVHATSVSPAASIATRASPCALPAAETSMGEPKAPPALRNAARTVDEEPFVQTTAASPLASIAIEELPGDSPGLSDEGATVCGLPKVAAPPAGARINDPTRAQATPRRARACPLVTRCALPPSFLIVAPRRL